MPDRIIKESICTSETLNKLTDFEECFWHRLTVNCDDYGRFYARSAILRGRLFPLREGCTDRNVADALHSLSSVGLVALYEVDGKPYLQLVTWAKHQRIRAKRSKFPAPDDTCCQMTALDVKCLRNPIQSESNPCENPNPNPNPTRPGAAASAYLDRVNPTASQQSLEELCAFVSAMGDTVCLRAIEIALDEKKATWSYIRGILRRWAGAGVTCVADIDRLEAEHDKKKSAGQARSAPPPESSAPTQADVAWMRDFLGKEGAP